MLTVLDADPLMTFPQLIRKHNLPKRSAYSWKDAGLFPVYQINRVILVRESEVLAALEKFRRIGKPPPIAGAPKHPAGPGRPKRKEPASPK